MRIFELHQTEISDDPKDLPTSQYMASGSTADVYLDPEQHDVIKKTKPSDPHGDHRSGYLKFAKLLSQDPDARHNPYFPKFYLISGTGDHQVFRLERLHNARDLNPEILEVLSNRAVRNFDDLFLEIRKTNTKTSLGMMSVLCYAINDAFVDGDVSRIKDPMLQKAISWLRENFPETGVGDLHSENVMVRLTGSGPQLVLVDPL